MDFSLVFLSENVYNLIHTNLTVVSLLAYCLILS